MQDISEDRFTFDPANLPVGTFVKLSDAFDLAFYGGVRTVSYQGPTPIPDGDDREYAITTAGEWVLITDRGPLLGPKWVDVAQVGALLFGIDDDSEPDPAGLADQQKKYLLRLERHRVRLADLAGEATEARDPQVGTSDAPVPRQPRPDAVAPYWKAEIARRRSSFFSKLNIAARSGVVRFMGTLVEEAWILETSTFTSLPQEIPAAYFAEDRGFEADLNCIDALGELAAETDLEDVSAGKYVSYRDVVVDRASFLKFLNTYYPAVLNPNLASKQLGVQQAIKVLTQALAEDNQMTKAAAAALVGRKERSNAFVTTIWPKARENNELPEQASPGRREDKSKSKSTQN